LDPTWYQPIHHQRIWPLIDVLGVHWVELNGITGPNRSALSLKFSVSFHQPLASQVPLCPQLMVALRCPNVPCKFQLCCCKQLPCKTVQPSWARLGPTWPVLADSYGLSVLGTTSRSPPPFIAPLTPRFVCFGSYRDLSVHIVIYSVLEWSVMSSSYGIARKSQSIFSTPRGEMGAEKG
jgi:hypothetical protein